ncbi:MAG: hypothetical protein A3I89_02290 [Candidatus Harrisonbacteria bacterium RIFCSPLOWO2_02_FULL_41_11]|uniref:SHS2 domain-containing protein n=1 Tax=Candidatus Harrisonbacteria bacterium RIFCSPHIGHO2_02_FULL_42_16 TaxID=1798404 RepID=A0A1G1ZJD1_9BACT|nr:MAG: hypothetical protein A3B92_03580 [Candidatus Harrisonbacteria bacterium RIFCSPHIGHO2_02_FULL_42_16]OGY66621.1 MAG: hypothetical protein A3I89_02290 [Candidatus Harrisonbacteria bacterium RIFCSPLOWO2_02_FULL_41_11]
MAGLPQKFYKLNKFVFGKLLKLLNPQVTIAGLGIGNAAALIVQFENGALKKSSVVLAPGIIEKGKVKDRNKFVGGLKKLHEQFVPRKSVWDFAGFSKSKEKIPVIVSLLSENVYTQIFSTPILPSEKLEEAAKLNMESISPANFDANYFDWQEAARDEKSGKIEFLGAFMDKSAVNEYVSALAEAGFIPIAVEFSALAIARTVKEFSVGIDLEKPQVVLEIGGDGIDFMVFNKGNLYFHYFVSWDFARSVDKVQGEISFEDIKELIIREIKKVSIFYANRWGGNIKDLILIAPASQPKIKKLIKENFSFEIMDLRLKEFDSFSSSWFSALGTALRGIMPRSEDNLISLMAVGTEEKYFQSAVMLFIKMWRNVIAATLLFLSAFFFFANVLMANTVNKLDNKLREITKAPEGEEVLALQNSANTFNRLADKVLEAKKQNIDWSPFFSKISSSAKKHGIFLTRLSLDSLKSAAILGGKADGDASAINFKNSLVDGGFKEVSLPLSDIIANKDGTVSFTITFKL